MNHQYNNTFEKAQFKHNALAKNVNGANYMFAVVYDILKGSSITVQHIFSIRSGENNQMSEQKKTLMFWLV